MRGRFEDIVFEESADEMLRLIAQARAADSIQTRLASMKVVGRQGVNLQECQQDARREGVVITQRGKPIAVVVDVEGLDLEQIELGYSDKFWKLVRMWRREKTISRTELEKRLASGSKRPLLNSRPSPRTSARPPGAPIVSTGMRIERREKVPQMEGYSFGAAVEQSGHIGERHIGDTCLFGSRTA